MAETKKREKNFDRSYSDNSGIIEIGHNDDTVLTVAVDSIHADTMKKAAMRYLCDILVGVGNAAMKAEGGSPEKAQEKMAETLAALQSGAFRFRAASGSAGLSLEDEQQVIAETLARLGKAETVEAALAKVAAIYARTSTNAKGYTVRKDYNALRAVPQIKAALADASKAGDNLDSLLA